ncbi:MAG: protein rep [Clostridia bacterium]|nr:protein rep [Clostridia bacterium]
MNFDDTAHELESGELGTKFVDRKLDNQPLIFSYQRLGMHDRAKLVELCGTYTEWHFFTDGSPPRLSFANFCKDRLCRMCTWRRTRKIYGQISQIMDVLSAQGYRFVFCTLTVRNCAGSDLIRTLDDIQSAFNRFMQRAKVHRAFKGVFKAVEITRHPEYFRSIEWHPHLHLIIAVRESYFHGKDYINHDELMQLWRECCRLDYDPSVEIHKVRAREMDDGEVSLKGAVLEVAKYTLKDADYLRGTDQQIDRAVDLLSTALAGRRLCSFTGVFKEIARKLKLDDVTDGDLVYTDNEQLRRDVEYVVVTYEWMVGFGYRMTRVRQMTDEEKEKMK